MAYPEGSIGVRHQDQDSLLVGEHRKNAIEQQQQESRVIIIDDANVFEGNLQDNPVFKELLERGVDILIFTSTNPDKLSTEELLNAKIAELGFGSSADGDFNPDLIACVANYLQGEVLCTVGQKWFDAMHQDDIDHLQEFIINKIKGDEDKNIEPMSPSDAFIEGMRYLVVELDREHVLESDGSELDAEESETSANTPILENEIPAPSTGSGELTETSPSPEPLPKEKKENLVVPALVGGAILLAMGVTTIRAIGKRRKTLSHVREQRAETLSEFSSLENLLNEWDSIKVFGEIKDAYEDSYQVDYVDILSKETVFVEQLARARKLDESLENSPVRIYSLQKTITASQENAQELGQVIGKLQALQKEIEEINNEVSLKLSEADGNLQKAQDLLASAKDTVKTWAASHPAYFPNSDEITSTLDAQLKAAEACFGENSKRILEGSNRSIEIIEDVDSLTTSLASFSELIKLRDTLVVKSAELAQSYPELVEKSDFPILKNQLDAVTLLLGANDFLEDLPGAVELAETEAQHSVTFFEDLKLTCQDFSEDSKSVEGYLKDKFYESHVSEQAKDAETFRTEAQMQAKKGAWIDAESLLRSSRVESASRVSILKELKKLRDDNEQTIDLLNIEVAKSQRHLSGTVSEHWKELDNLYKPSNYTGYEKHVENAGTLLKKVFDDPSNIEDLASKAERKNSMGSKENPGQKFSEAQAILSTMQHHLAEANELINALEERYELIKESEKSHSSVAATAREKILRAKELIRENDQFIKESTADILKGADTVLLEYDNAVTRENYVLALDLATNALRVAESTIDSAQNQIETVRKQFAKLDQSREDCKARISDAISKVNQEFDTIVSSETRRFVAVTQAAVTILAQEERALVKLEDTTLLAEISRLIDMYDDLESTAEITIATNLLDDQERYSDQFDVAKKAIKDAKAAINAAQKVLDDSRSSGVGFSQLHLAESRLPDEPIKGVALSVIEGVTSRAKASQALAEEAHEAAKNAIEQAIAEKKRLDDLEAERQRKKKAEEDRKAREAQAEKNRKAQEAQLKKQRDAMQQKARERASRPPTTTQRIGKASGGLPSKKR